MKQIEYTEKQKIVLEVLEDFENLFKQDYKAYDFQKKKWFDRISLIKEKYGIKEKYLTLRDYINAHSCGAYHSFIFKINDISINTIGVNEFALYYNTLILDLYYVIKDKTQSYGNNCENYHCEHFLEIVEKE